MKIREWLLPKAEGGFEVCVSKNDFTAMQDLARELAGRLKLAIRHAEEFHEGCLWCGVPLDQVYDKDHNVLQSHIESCWYYSSEEALKKARDFGVIE